MDTEGIKFLDKLYQDLYMSDVVQHTKDNKDNRTDAIRKYLERLERVHKMADTESKKRHLLNLYFDKYVIKAENIPYGVDKEAIISAQKKTLSMWIDYLSDPTTTYPMWAKYWAFQGMLKMGSYDESKEEYLRRDKKTTAPFVEPNPEIIAKSIEVITKLVKGEEIDDIIEERLSKTDSFKKIYTIFEKKFKNNIVDKTDSKDGIWIKYNQGSKDDAYKLSKSLENMNTGWCTAGETMAEKQVCGPYNDSRKGGDFYVYYTKDKDGNYTIPRIAVRCINHDCIGEIRGIEAGQNLEESMIGVLEEKLKSMTFLSPNVVKENLEIIEGLKELTRIGIKTERGEPLTDDEINNLYQKKYGFGYQQEPKVAKIQNKRNPEEDYNMASEKTKIIFISSLKLPNSIVVDDRELMVKAIQKDAFSIMYASEKLKDDKELILMAARKNSITFKFASERLKDDRNLVMEITQNDALMFMEASQRLKGDRELALIAIKGAGIMFKYVSEELKNNRDFVMEAIKLRADAFDYIPDQFRDDEEIIMEMVKDEPLKMMRASDRIRSDKRIALKVININAAALYCLSDELKNDKEVVLAAMKSKGSELDWVSSELRDDKEVVITALRNGGALLYASNRLQKDKEVVLAAVTADGMNLNWASHELQSDKDVVLAAAKSDPRSLEFAPLEIVSDKDIMLKAIGYHFEALQFAFYTLREDEDFIKQVDKIKQEKDRLDNRKKIKKAIQDKITKIGRKFKRKTLFGFIQKKEKKKPGLGM